LDEKFVANLEHLLLRIRSILVQLLVRQAYALLQRLSKALCGRTTSRAFDYYAEFPSGRRPLSTTWPWSIKPSLAVLWGVCWMFFNSEHETTLSQESYDASQNAPSQAGVRNVQASEWRPDTSDAYIDGVSAQNDLQQQQQEANYTVFQNNLYSPQQETSDSINQPGTFPQGLVVDTQNLRLEHFLSSQCQTKMDARSSPISAASDKSVLSKSSRRLSDALSNDGQSRYLPETLEITDVSEGVTSPGDAAGRGRSHQRGEPPRNSQNKIICAKCARLVFDRKCEWSKHMDKHDRPYKCTEQGCEKLQGFTYSGGLLRHEREVHKMHGGAKEPLMCPYLDCKRSSGQGFTRKENLNEHIRRVHRSASAESAQVKQEDRTLDEAVSPTDSKLADTVDMAVPLSTRKRKRHSVDSELTITDDDDLREEVRRLRRENDQKDERLRVLENLMEDMRRSVSG
ncbi:hypothetical protein BJ546DRAFT_846016, partial [Cryomyces antarcticus]